MQKPQRIFAAAREPLDDLSILRWNGSVLEVDVFFFFFLLLRKFSSNVSQRKAQHFLPKYGQVGFDKMNLTL
jgi:hypothetical protein